MGIWVQSQEAGIKHTSGDETPFAGDIRTVAGQYIEDLYRHEWLDWFQMVIPPKAVIPNHQTGPRILILMTDLNGHRLDDGSPIYATKSQTMFLENTFSNGFVNTSEQVLVYQVLAFSNTPKLVETAASESNDFHESAWKLRLQFNEMLLYVAKQPTVTKASQPLLQFEAKNKQVVEVGKGEQLTVQPGDWLLEISTVWPG